MVDQNKMVPDIDKFIFGSLEEMMGSIRILGPKSKEEL